MKLAVVIVHYNSSADLDRCLESLVACAPRFEHEIVIVDNASQDDGLAEVHRNYRDFTWVFSQENTGYSRGVNLGMAQVEADYYLVLNPDIVVQPGALEHLIAFADRHPRAGIIGPQLLNEDGSVQESCRRFYTFSTLVLRRTFVGKIFPDSQIVRRHLMKDFDHQSSRPVDWVLGGCILVRRSAMDRTGPMDERFFLYFEDVDWCYRMWQAGHEVMYTPEARFIHRHRRESAKGSFNRTFWMHLGSLISFYEKWGILVWLLKKWRGALMVFLLWLADMVGLSAAFAAAYGLRGLIGALIPGLFAQPLYPFGEYQPLLLFSLVLASVTFLMTGRYSAEGQRRFRPVGEHLKQVGAVAILLMASSYLGHMEVVSRAVLLLFIPLLGVTTLVGDSLFRKLLVRLEKGRLSLERTLLVGAPDTLGAWLAGSPQLTEVLLQQGVDLAGYCASPPTDDLGLPPLAGGRVPWLGSSEELVAMVGRYRIGQVVFWDRPQEGSASWQQLAALRRMRVRLRWQVPDVWLLAARTRTEVFGPGLSAVQDLQGTTLFKVLARRTAGLLVGIVLVVLSLPGQLALRSWLVRSGRSRIEKVSLTDIWGHDPRVDLVLDGEGRIRSLGWQWGLAWALLKGRLLVWGPQASLTGQPPVPQDPDQEMSFWQEDPMPPGLAGSWLKEDSEPRWSFWRMLVRAWRRPCGFPALRTPPQDAEIPTKPDKETRSRPAGEVKST